jgi:tetratricopeptide (TPR) repeat protein
VVIVALLVTGCATTPHWTPQQLAAVDARLNDENPPEQLRPLYRMLYLQGDWNYVLNAMKLSGVAIRLGYYDYAKHVLDEAIRRIEGITTGPQAAAARSTFKAEEVKPFKGEPYERAMVYFYRGLFYYRDGVYDNARACFRSALLEDANAEGEQYKADYCSLEYLSAKCSQKLQTGDFDDAMKRAQQNLRRGGLLPSVDPANNLLVACFLGQGPTKVATGRHGELLRFQEQHFPETRARIVVDGKAAEGTAELDNLYWQATTRGGRVMDGILAGKAVFKDTAETVGDVGLLTGAGLAIAGANSNSDELMIAGAATAAAGMISKMCASSAHPEADIRYWDNLPNLIEIASLKLPAGPHKIRIEFLDAKGVKVSGLDREFDVTIPESNQEQVVIVHSR